MYKLNLQKNAFYLEELKTLKSTHNVKADSHGTVLSEWAEGHWQSDSHSRLAFLGSTVKSDPSLKLFQQCWSCEGNKGQIANTHANTHTQKTWSIWLAAGICSWLLHRGDAWFDTVKGQRLNNSIFTFFLTLLSFLHHPSGLFLYCVKWSCLFLSLHFCLSLTACASHFLCLSLCWTSWLAGFLCVSPRGGQWVSGVIASGRLPECVVRNDTYRQTCHNKMLF